MTGNGGDCVWSRRMGMRPLGSRRRNQSFFCSLVMMLLGIYQWVEDTEMRGGRGGEGRGVRGVRGGEGGMYMKVVVHSVP